MGNDGLAVSRGSATSRIYDTIIICLGTRANLYLYAYGISSLLFFFPSWFSRAQGLNRYPAMIPLFFNLDFYSLHIKPFTCSTCNYLHTTFAV
ncbi:hypothetical protein J3F83DRAFT_722229 [Trichoderma novae-zelandiae]